MKLGDDGLPTSTTREELAEIGARISAAERRAMAAERETVDRLIAHLLADRIGATFEGRISGVTRSGLFVKLAETGADGFVPAATIGADYYRFDEGHHALVGDRTGETYRLGDPVSVRLIEAAPVAGALRFELLSDGRMTAKPGKGRRGAKAPSRAADAAHGKTRPRTSESRSRKDGRGGKVGGPAPPEDKASREKTPRGKITPRVKGERARRRNDESASRRIAGARWTNEQRHA